MSTLPTNKNESLSVYSSVLMDVQSLQIFLTEILDGPDCNSAREYAKVKNKLSLMKSTIDQIKQDLQDALKLQGMKKTVLNLVSQNQAAWNLEMKIASNKQPSNKRKSFHELRLEKNLAPAPQRVSARVPKKPKTSTSQDGNSQQQLEKLLHDSPPQQKSLIGQMWNSIRSVS